MCFIHSHTCTQEKKKAKFGGREGGEEGDGGERTREKAKLLPFSSLKNVLFIFAVKIQKAESSEPVPQVLHPKMKV